ncbi:cation:proton antiporter [Deinococcus lacus]|uniref:Cation:proton antiporter n=1 Tax=Deinococcus lacus TaxID=392561 RepID=A0ABW1YHT8_9DEIO
MTAPALLALVFSLTALLSYVNGRFFHLPPTLGVLLGGLLLAVTLTTLRGLGLGWALEEQLRTIPFDQVVMGWLLSFLLFASAMQTDAEALLRERWVVSALAVVTTLTTMTVLGGRCISLCRLRRTR